ncbi:hypothetical protein DFH11DRAFT_1783632 [Phellopilus nigrolimitatus]|nr:hypothetical protein DFH11DRAFT_1783632 [Phellopilus nigrolimitatus]
MQYTAGVTQAYYGGADGYGADPGYDARMPPAPGVVPGTQPAPSGQLFTPSLVGEGQSTGKQTQQSFQSAAFKNTNVTGFGSGAPVHPPMGLGDGKKPHALYTTKLLTAPACPRELYAPPFEIHLLPNGCVSPLPHADPSYQRCAINAVPTTSALLNKSKLPPHSVPLAQGG